MEPFVQLPLLAQGPDMEEWVNILFIAVLAVLYLAGALIKAASRKGQAERRRQEGLANERRRARGTWQERLARKAEELQRAAEAKGRRAVERARQLEQEVGLREQGGRPRPAQPPTGRITIRPGQRGESVMVYEQPGAGVFVDRQQPAQPREPRQALRAARQRAPQPPPPAVPKIETGGPTFEPLVEGLTGITLQPPKPLEVPKEEWEMPGGRAGFHATALIDYRDPDALKKAILHYEILGKPIALRDPSERTAVF